MIQLSETAAEKIKVLIARQSLSDEGGLRIYANSGCCSNSSYGMALEQKQHPEDNVFFSRGVRVLIDPTSFGQLEGVSVEYYQDENNQGFTIAKPHDHNHCECGGSCNS
ncbi:MAG: iron-sulfur cluster assembly accessory protein [Candidatus Marinimicrobia bacterium]|nr:iron-sulfur cluster assembly accessory protein [Candidatus Neomarinimicrobiota bacterium]